MELTRGPLVEGAHKERRAFLERYHPDRLRGLQGVELLDRLCGTDEDPGSGMFYQLEFGQTKSWGGIGGGSAVKFEVYRGQDGSWKKRGSGNVGVSCTEAEATQLAEQLVLGVLLPGNEAAQQLASNPTDRETWQTFSELSMQLPRLYPGNQPLLERGWAHKYLCLLFPDLFSFHHSPSQLRNHLIRLLVVPEDTRWLLDHQWLTWRTGSKGLRQFAPLVLGEALYAEWPGWPRYWQMDSPDSQAASGWLDLGHIEMGWPEVGDLTTLIVSPRITENREAARTRLSGAYPDEDPGIASQLVDFYRNMAPGDRVALMDGGQAISVGEVLSEVSFDASRGHRRLVRWGGGCPLPRVVTQRCPLAEVTERHGRVKVAMESALWQTSSTPSGEVSPPAQPAPPLSALGERLHAILERKGQAILYGPPGTGKTYHARALAEEVLARELFRTSSAALLPQQRQRLGECITFCTFHPAYGYEEFLEGYRPVITESGAPAFRLEHGVFRSVCERARETPGHHHFLIIDEINRGNIASILGECITLIELDKRERLSVTLPFSKARFTVPRNVWILGTMNTADRSISLLDTALRRRFGFLELMPDPSLLVAVEDLPLSALLSELNRRVRAHIGRNARELQIGHAYLWNVRTAEELAVVVREDLLPLLSEYCYDSWETLHAVLGDDFVERSGQSLRQEVLMDTRRCFAALRGLVAGELSEPEEPA